MRLLFFFLALSLLPLTAHECNPKIHICSSSDEVGEVCAREIAALIQRNQREGKPTVLGLATGSTPVPVYRALQKIVKEENLDLSQLITFNLDEYVGLSPEHPESYHAFMEEHLFSHLPGIKKENIYIPNTLAAKEKDLSREEIRQLNAAFPNRKKRGILSEEEKIWILNKRAQEYETLIAKLGPIQIQILGIGTNGHIGFAEPGSSFAQGTSLVELTENTRKDNARFFGNDLLAVPEYAMTMGIKTILQAERIFLLATGEHKARIIKAMLDEPISNHIPATALRLHPRAEVYLDEKAASKMRPQGKITRFFNGRVVKNHKLEEGEIWVVDGKITPPQTIADEEIDVKGEIIAPGYIDLQINGGFGVDFSLEPERIEEVAAHLPKYGVTSFVPTIVSSHQNQYKKILSSLTPKVMTTNRGAHILGMHLEGPILNPKRCGAHDSSLFCSLEDCCSPNEFYGNLTGVKIITLAPEVEGAYEAIEHLRDLGIVVAVGHSTASLQEFEEATEKGVCLVTHLFNGMDPLHHRNPGIIGAVLSNRNLPYSVIADGHHIHPKILKLAWHAHPEGMILISDANAACGLTPGEYLLGMKEIEVNEHKRAVLKGTNVLAGSVLSLDEAVRNLRRFVDCSIVQAIEAATLKPAQVLGIEKIKGTLEEGADADIIILNDHLIVQECYLRGEPINFN